MHTGFIIGYLRMDGCLSHCFFPAPQWVIFCLNSQERNVFSTIWLMLTGYLSSLGDRGSKSPKHLLLPPAHRVYQPSPWQPPAGYVEKQVINRTTFYTGLEVPPTGLRAAGTGDLSTSGRGSRNEAFPIIFRGLSTRWLNKQA